MIKGLRRAVVVWALWVALDGGAQAQWGPVLVPELVESVPLIGADQVHRLGITGEGVGVAIVDVFTPNPADPCQSAHGAWVEGIVRGVAPGARLLRYNVRTEPFGARGGCFKLSPRALNAALGRILREHEREGIRVVNLSWGGGRYASACGALDDQTSELLRRLHDEGLVLVAAAGNEGQANALLWPACLPEVISVGAVYDYTASRAEWTPVCAQVPMVDRVTCYSNSARFLDLLAPGSVITTDRLAGAGTSAAAPHVSGVSALVLERDPALSPEAVRDLLRDTGRVVRDERNGRTFPRVDALAAVTALRPPAPTAALKGDVNRDGTVDDADVLLLLSALGEIATLDAAQRRAADVAPPCQDEPTFADLRWLRAMIAGQATAQCPDTPSPQEALAAGTPLRVEDVLARRTAAGVVFQVVGAVGNAELTVFDLSGRPVFQTVGPARALRWDLRDRAGRPVPNGVYLYRVRALNGPSAWASAPRKLALLR